MKIEGGFWQNFKASLGLGLGGGLGAGFGWRVGQWLGELFIRLMKWIGILAIGAGASWYAGVGNQKPPEQIQREGKEARAHLEKTNPEMLKFADKYIAAQKEKQGAGRE